MLTEQDLQALSSMMDIKLNPIKEQLEVLQESIDEVRGTTNQLVEWAEEAAIQVHIPLFKKTINL